ncbi:MAG: hypothetical protein QJR03_13960 [Sphaerobacter sp.]|nr:hypothetical protein [Sphaerobacter sp.]
MTEGVEPVLGIGHLVVAVAAADVPAGAEVGQGDPVAGGAGDTGVGPVGGYVGGAGGQAGVLVEDVAAERFGDLVVSGDPVEPVGGCEGTQGVVEDGVDGPAGSVDGAVAGDGEGAVLPAGEPVCEVDGVVDGGCG